MIVDATTHYDLMIGEMDDPTHPVGDPFHDTGRLRDWYGQANGPAFVKAIGDVRGKRVLEVGVGTGRVTRQLLELGCARLTGIDVSARSLARARENLAAWPDVELLERSAESFVRREGFDLACAVWTFCHIVRKREALANMVASLAPGGRLALSLECGGEWLDYGPRLIRLYQNDPDTCAGWLRELGCRVALQERVVDVFAADGDCRLLAVVLAAVKP